jgi:hypothetical protein
MEKVTRLAVTHTAGDDSIFERCRNCRFACQWRMTGYTQVCVTISNSENLKKISRGDMPTRRKEEGRCVEDWFS